uniref:RNA helicase n=1 Tax=viral metagenome TaxID=1070528 RepID=A0A6C0DC61_9ZZZZ
MNDNIDSNVNIKTINTWDDFELKDGLLRGIYAYGFENPSEIQKKAILPIISGNDTIAQAQSGTGKTGAFSISTLQRIDINKKELQGLIIVPTHELAKQISSVITSIGNSMEGLVIKTMIGGISVQQDISDMNENPPHVIVGCAGRIYDMIRRKNINVNTVKLFILDEADEMLSGAFKDQIYNIFQHFNSNIQVAIFSATMPEEILTLSNKFMRNPIKITMKKEELNLEGIQQYFIAIQNDFYKFETLKQLFTMISVNQCIIYCNSVKRVIDLHRAMSDEGFSVCAIHSSMDKVERDNTFRNFRSGGYRVLISSNITARGIDVQQVATVINFDITNCVHTYLHRIGRSGRWGRKGLAINFVTKRDIGCMRNIEEHYKISINELPKDFQI